MKFRILLLTALAIAAPGVVGFFGWGSMGCSSGSSGSDSEDVVAASNYTMPTEISAVPASSSAISSLAAPLSFKAAINRLTKAATDADTDYTDAITKTFIEERTLEQFDILETVMSATEQTNYTAEIGNGPFTAKVAWEDTESKGSVEVDTKTVETWICQADWVDAAGNVVADQASAAGLRLRAWIEEESERGTQIVKAQILITTPAERNSDGSYANYGEWTMNVKFGDTANDYFVASSSISGDDNIIMVHEKFAENFPGASEDMSTLSDKTVETKAILHRSATSGYGKVAYPDFEAMYNPDTMGTLTSIPILTATYAYNATHLGVKNADEAAVFKDRNSTVPMTHRYGVFNADTGANLTKSKSFGFPVRFASGDNTVHGYYGSWQGRHQLWMGMEQSVAEGTEVTRDDLPPGEEESYVIGPTYNGTFAKRSYIDADLADIENIPVEIWIDQNFQLIFANNAWYECYEVDWMNPGQCAEGQLADTAFDLTSLLVGESDTKKGVWINGFDQNAMQDKQFVYVAGDGLYEAEQQDSQFGPRFVSTGTPIDSDSVPMLWINIGGSIYVEYKGTALGWVEKELLSFDTMSWTPTFSDNDKSYSLPENRELYINMEGANYIVNRSGADYTVKLELQSVANPTNAATFVSAGTVFANNWDEAGSGSEYEFITDSADPNFLMLVYKTIGDNDMDSEGNANEGIAVGAVVATNIWGLRATVDGEPTDFNWEYSSESGGWGSVTYLKNADGTFKILDDPVQFDSIVVTNGAGDQKTLSLKFDGWMHGLPEMYNELEKNGWVITTDLKNKIINIPVGTGLVDTVTGIEYLLKPLEQGLFLEVVADPGTLNLDAAAAVDLSTVPEFTEHGMGDVPADAPLYYSEGECVDDSHCGT